MVKPNGFMTDIDSLLVMWGRWAAKFYGEAVGYADTSPMFRGYKSDVEFRSSEPFGVRSNDMSNVDNAVNSLPSGLRAVVISHYLYGGSVRDTAKRVGFHHRSVTDYIARSHGLISQKLDEIRCGA